MTAIGLHKYSRYTKSTKKMTEPEQQLKHIRKNQKLGVVSESKIQFN